MFKRTKIEKNKANSGNNDKKFLGLFKIKEKKYRKFTNKYDKLLNISLILLLIFNIYTMFIEIGEINWKSIGLFSLSILILRFYLFKIFKYRKDSYLTIFVLFVKKIITNIFLIIFFFYFFTFYQNELNPAKLSINYLTNGNKEVVFVEMAHIGSKDYYDKVNKILEEKNKEGYVLFYEGVNLDVPKEKVVEKLGILPTEETYNTITSLLGNNIEVQDTLSMLRKMDKASNTDVNFSELLSNDNKVDLESSTGIYNSKEAFKDENYKEKLKKEKKKQEEEIRKEYCEKHKDECDKDGNIITKGLTKEEQEAKKKEELANELLSQEKELLNNGAKGVMIKYVLKSIFNFSIKHEETFSKLIGYIDPSKEDFFSTQVLDKRNKKLAYNIINSPEEKIIITYGGKHFKGVLDILKKDDPKWKIIKSEKIPIFK